MDKNGSNLNSISLYDKYYTFLETSDDCKEYQNGISEEKVTVVRTVLKIRIVNLLHKNYLSFYHVQNGNINLKKVSKGVDPIPVDTGPESIPLHDRSGPILRKFADFEINPCIWGLHM